MCEFHVSNGKGLGDIWWTDKFFYFSIIDVKSCTLFLSLEKHSEDLYNVFVFCLLLLLCQELYTFFSLAYIFEL